MPTMRDPSNLALTETIHPFSCHDDHLPWRARLRARAHSLNPDELAGVVGGGFILSLPSCQAACQADSDCNCPGRVCSSGTCEDPAGRPIGSTDGYTNGFY